jgi:hypothetical protein
MTDIVERLRSLRYLRVPCVSNDAEEAAAEIERLRDSIRRFADQDATLSVQGGNVTVTIDATLTAEEREAIEVAAAAYADDHGERFAATLRSLLTRLAVK